MTTIMMCSAHYAGAYRLAIWAGDAGEYSRAAAASAAADSPLLDFGRLTHHV